MVYIFILFVSPLILCVCVCVCRYSLTNTLSWRWCRTVSWIFTASSQGSNTLMWTPPTFKPMMASKWTKQRIEARQWRAELCPWGETFSCFMWSVFTSEMDFFSHLSFRHCTLPPAGKHVSSRGQGVSRSSVFYLSPYALLWYLWSFFCDLWLTYWMRSDFFILKITLESLLFDCIDCHCHSDQAVCSHSIINFPYWLLYQIDYWSDCPVVGAPRLQILQVAPGHDCYITVGKHLLSEGVPAYPASFPWSDNVWLVKIQL